MRFNRAQLIPRQKNKLEELRAEVSSNAQTQQCSNLNKRKISAKFLALTA